MNGIEHDTARRVTIEAGARGTMAALVKGREKALIKGVRPLLGEQSVILDMRHVERIDAAGITALITLYCAARQSGHAFTVSHALPRVEEILALVGVKHLLTSAHRETAHEMGYEIDEMAYEIDHETGQKADQEPSQQRIQGQENREQAIALELQGPPQLSLILAA